MFLSLVMLSATLATQQVSTESTSYLQRTERALALCQSDIPAMRVPAEQAASRLAAGGQLWAAGQESLCRELCGRAGGMMLIQRLGDKTPEDGDVVLYGSLKGTPLLESLSDTKALVVAFGAPLAKEGVAAFSNHAEETGLSPTHANLIPAWVFTGELVAALTRQGKIPVLFETIGMYGGFARIDKYLRRDVLWHEDLTVPPVSPGEIGKSYIAAVSKMLLRIEADERKLLDRAGVWAQRTQSKKKRAYMYGQGHFVPSEIAETEIGTLFEASSWNAGFVRTPPKENYTQGDLVVCVGYQHPPSYLLAKARAAKTNVVYVTVLGDRDYDKDSGVVWIDPMWRWADACVSLGGYDIPILPPSGIVNSAIAWEILRLAKKP